MALAGAPDASSSDPAATAGSLVGLFAASVAEVLVVSWFIARTHLRGFQLALQVFVMIFGVMFFMTQIETLYFNAAIGMPSGVVAATVASGFVAALAVAALAPRYARRLAPPSLNLEPRLPRPQPIAAFALLGVVYVALYFLAGYFIAWQSPTLREFYSGTSDILPFWEHMLGTFQSDPFLTPFQFLRGLMWTALGLSVLSGLKAQNSWQSYAIVAASLSVGLAAPLLIPNPYMPDIVRSFHFAELLVSNIIFGVVLVWIFNRSS